MINVFHESAVQRVNPSARKCSQIILPGVPTPLNLMTPPPHQGKVFTRKFSCNKRFITNKVKLKIVQYQNKFSFEIKQIN